MLGMQAGRHYYVAMVPFKHLSRIVRPPDHGAAPQERHQRLLNKGRIPRISDYLTANPKDYVLSSIVVILNGDYTFTPTAGADQLGTLRIPLDADLKVLDGQHRVAAIERALVERPQLGDDTVPVQIFLGAGVKRAQQFFADLNAYAVRPSRSVSVLYDHRNALAAISRSLIGSIPLLSDLTDVEHSSVPARSGKLFALAALNRAVAAMWYGCGELEPEGESGQITLRYWGALCESIGEWKDAWKGDVSCHDLRKDSVVAHGVVHHALGLIGRDVVAGGHDIGRYVRKLAKIDWSRGRSGGWEGRAMMGGRMVNTAQSVVLTANRIRNILGLQLHGAAKQLEISKASFLPSQE